MGDRFDLQQIGHDHPRRMNLKRAYDRHRVTCRLDDHLIILGQRAPQPLQARPRHVDPPRGV